jgi:hypothetical protein
MCDNADNYKGWTNCKVAFETKGTKESDGKYTGAIVLSTLDNYKCYHDKESTDNQKSCDWAFCAAWNTNKDIWDKSNCGMKYTGITYGNATTGVGHLGEALYGKVDAAMDKYLTWDHCSQNYSMTWKADKKSNCGVKYPDAATKEKGDCVYGDSCTYDLCHSDADAKKADNCKDCSATSTDAQKSWCYRKSLADVKTRADWTSLNKKDANDYKTETGKSAGLKTKETDDCKKKTTTAEKTACTKATKNVTDNTDAIADTQDKLAWNQQYRNFNDKTWWTADTTKAYGKDSVEADGTTCETDAKSRQSAAKKATAAAVKAVGTKYDKTTKECAEVDKKADDSHDCLDLKWANANEKTVDAHVATAVANNKNDWDDTKQAWFGYWNTNAIINADDLKAAKALQATNVANVTAATKATSKTHAHLTILQRWETAGKDAIHNVDHQKTWHANSLKAATTKDDVDAIKKVDEKEAKDAKAAEATACKAPQTTKAEKDGCTAATAWTAMQNQFVKDDDARVTALAKAKSSSSKSKATTNAKQGKTKKEADAILTTLKAAETKADNAVKATEKSQKTGDCSTKAKEDDADCKKYAGDLVTEKAALAKATTAVKTQEAYIKKNFGSSGATVGIIVGCVVGVLCLGGGAAWYIKHKKAEDAGFVDDLYTPFVDAEL